MLSRARSKELKEIAEKFKSTPAKYGEDLNLDDYITKVENIKKISTLENLDEISKKSMTNVGINLNESNIIGTYLQINQDPVYSTFGSNTVIMPLSVAFSKYDLSEYYWNAVKITDKYAARAELELTEGYFIRVPKGIKEKMPLQSCLLISEDDVTQNVHNIIIVEEDAELHIISGCTTPEHVESGLHIGVTEIYIKKGGKLTFTMVHNWGKNVHVRPRTAIVIEENGIFINNYVILNPVKSIQSYPTAFCNGDNSKAVFQSISYGKKDSVLDLGTKVILNGKNSSADIISRSISVDNSKSIARGHLIGGSENVRGHLECNGLILSDSALIYAVPVLEAKRMDLNLSHEAAVGKIAEEELNYLMSRGLSESDATSLIIKGFLSVDITGLPDNIAEQVKDLIDKTIESAM
ncbi:MAG: SufD family Fe-S cluster assembly protein [Methanosarcinales archaeon]|jgi:Fe-S cluster assembly scaffold protein SufB|nr:SufD family Fe-S cluster assembly protein [Methanosarcinales archaeon]